MLSARRTDDRKHESLFEYMFTKDASKNFNIRENTYLVDGIGGRNWDGALIMSKLLEEILASSRLLSKHEPIHLVELGCGAGICGIVGAKLGTLSTLTDRYSDLASLNIVKSSSNGALEVSVEDSDAKLASFSRGTNSNIVSMDLEWEHASETIKELVRIRGKADLIVGAEICCLRKQQGLLVNTTVEICDSNPDAVILLSFDGRPPPNDCQYEKEMMQRMKEKKFLHAVVHTGTIEWSKQTMSPNPATTTPETTGSAQAYYSDITHLLPNDLDKVAFPRGIYRYLSELPPSAVMNPATGDSNTNCRSKPQKYSSMNMSTPSARSTPRSPMGTSSAKSTCTQDAYATVPPTPPELEIADAKYTPHHSVDCNTSRDSNCKAVAAAERTPIHEDSMHHIIVFYRPTAVNTCRRCHKQFFRHARLNTGNGEDEGACRFHSGYFVCRRHPGETKCSINGVGDGLGYYGNGREDWAAEFWDCCGSEDRNAPGCHADAHVAYS